jgi:regulator of ribonuclease activity A
VQWQSFGAVAFAGPVATVRCFEDNVLVKQQLSSPGDGRVLVVDAGGSLRCALVGDNLARLGLDNGWAGIVLYGCVRDSAALDELGGVAKGGVSNTFGVKALGTNPRPSNKGGAGEIDVPVTFGEITFTPGAQLVADRDGVVLLA